MDAEAVMKRRKGKPGQPSLACNLWLAAQVDAHPELRAWPSVLTCPPVYEQWLLRHELERRYTLATPRRSFRAALRTIISKGGKP